MRPAPPPPPAARAQPAERRDSSAAAVAAAPGEKRGRGGGVELSGTRRPRAAAARMPRTARGAPLPATLAAPGGPR